MLEKFVEVLQGSLQKVELTSTSRNDCGTKKLARHVHIFRVCYTGQFFLQLVSKQNCETSCEKIALCNSVFSLMGLFGYKSLALFTPPYH